MTCQLYTVRDPGALTAEYSSTLASTLLQSTRLLGTIERDTESLRLGSPAKGASTAEWIPTFRSPPAMRFFAGEGCGGRAQYPNNVRPSVFNGRRGWQWAIIDGGLSPTVARGMGYSSARFESVHLRRIYQTSRPHYWTRISHVRMHESHRMSARVLQCPRGTMTLGPGIIARQGTKSKFRPPRCSFKCPRERLTCPSTFLAKSDGGTSEVRIHSTLLVRAAQARISPSTPARN